MSKKNIVEIITKNAKIRNKNTYITTSSLFYNIFKELKEIFLLPIDLKRTQDYLLDEIDLEQNKITITDKKTNIIYTSEITSNINELNLATSKDKFVKTTIIYPNYSEKNIYNLKGELLMGKINEQQSTREIEITKYEEAANKFTSLSTPNVTLKYFKHQNNSKIRLYEKNISSVSSLGPTALKVSEKYSINPLKSKSKISLNDYYYSLKKNIIYGINGLEEKNNSIVKSIFFRKIPKTIEEFLPSAMSTRTYQELADENTNSALIFRGATIDSYHHYLNIYKTNEGLKLSYQVEDPKEAQHNKRYYKINDSTVLSSATPNDISTTEISYLIEYLKLNYNNEFISQVLMILENIYNQIQNPTLYNKEKETFKDINLLNDSFLTIKQKLTENLNEYIDEITSEYIAVNRNKQLTYKNNKN